MKELTLTIRSSPEEIKNKCKECIKHWPEYLWQCISWARLSSQRRWEPDVEVHARALLCSPAVHPPAPSMITSTL